MMKSMTGFSKVETSSDGIKLTVEIKSLNGKGFDINFRMPRQLSSKEIEFFILVFLIRVDTRPIPTL